LSLRRAFTLIELLIVVAIIAILAAIAVPNFLEAQTRSKVSRVKADQRSIATAIEAYYVDNNRYPAACAFSGNTNRVLFGGVPAGSITTPIAYMTSIPGDPWSTFLDAATKSNPGDLPFGYDKAGFGFNFSGAFGQPGTWSQMTTSSSPSDGVGFVVQLPADFAKGLSANGAVTVTTRDVNKTPLRWALWSIGPTNNLPPQRQGDQARSRFIVDCRYDPTNGTVSAGYILRYGTGTIP
jgi:type II secretion system protein G